MKVEAPKAFEVRRPDEPLALPQSEEDEPDGMYVPDDVLSQSENASISKTMSDLKGSTCSRRSLRFASQEAIIVPITPPAHPSRAGQFSELSAVRQGRPTVSPSVLRSAAKTRRRKIRGLPKPPARGSGAYAPHYGAWSPTPKQDAHAQGVMGLMLFLLGTYSAYTSPQAYLSIFLLGAGWWSAVSAASCWRTPQATDEVPRRQGLFCVKFDDKGREGVRSINLVMTVVFLMLLLFKAGAVIATFYLTFNSVDLDSSSRTFSLCLALFVSTGVLLRLLFGTLVNFIISVVLPGWKLWDPWWEMQVSNSRLVLPAKKTS